MTVLRAFRQYRQFTVSSEFGVGGGIVYASLGSQTYPVTLPTGCAAMIVNSGLQDALLRFSTSASTHIDATSSAVHRLPAGTPVLFDESETSHQGANFVAVTSCGGNTSEIGIFVGATKTVTLFEDPSPQLYPFGQTPSSASGAQTSNGLALVTQGNTITTEPGFIFGSGT